MVKNKFFAVVGENGEAAIYTDSKLSKKYLTPKGVRKGFIDIESTLSYLSADHQVTCPSIEVIDSHEMRHKLSEYGHFCFYCQPIVAEEKPFNTDMILENIGLGNRRFFKMEW